MKDILIKINYVLETLKNRCNLSDDFYCDFFNYPRNYLNLIYKSKRNIDEKKLYNLDDYVLKHFGKSIVEIVFEEKTNHLFHGSRNGIVGEIDINYSNNRINDFGKGFYLGESFIQSATFISQNDNNDGIIYEFEFNDKELRKLHLEDDVWIFYIAHNRLIKDSSIFKKIEEKIKEIEDGNYDYVYGYIADDKMFSSMNRFFDNLLSTNDLYKCIEFNKIGKQYCLKTNKAVKQLSLVAIYRLDKNVNQLFNKYNLFVKSDIINSASETYKHIDRNGKYFEDLLDEYK